MSVTHSNTQDTPYEASLPPDNNTVIYGSVKTTSMQPNGSRPDWILYTIPATACLLGVCLFSLVLRKHRGQRPERNLGRRGCNKMMQKDARKLSEHRLNGLGSTSSIKNSDVLKGRSMETQSYENVEAAIYSNQEEVSYYIPAQDGDDYVFPDAEGCDTEEGGGERQNDCLYPPQNLTDTDGESYENMESSLYAQPRRQTQRCMDADEEDYIDPDGGNGERGEGENHCNNLCPRQNLTDTDGESYENMESSLYAQPRCHSDPNRPHSPHASQEEEEEEDSYEKMASITQPDT